jgi:hypothetical protein
MTGKQKGGAALVAAIGAEMMAPHIDDLLGGGGQTFASTTQGAMIGAGTLSFLPGIGVPLGAAIGAALGAAQGAYDEFGPGSRDTIGLEEVTKERERIAAILEHGALSPAEKRRRLEEEMQGIGEGAEGQEWNRGMYEVLSRMLDEAQKSREISEEMKNALQGVQRNAERQVTRMSDTSGRTVGGGPFANSVTSR